MRSITFLFIIFITAFSGDANAQDKFVFRHLKLEGAARTKPVVFLREIGQKINDTISNADSMSVVWQKRISGLGLFNTVDVKCIKDTLKISVKERIYTWILPEITWADRNFNVWWATKDFSRLIYGGTIYFNNLHGLNHNLAITVIHGYNRQYSMAYNKPFSNHKSGWAYSASAGYWSNHELWYKTENDKLQFLRIEKQPVQRNLWLSFNLKKRLSYFSRLEAIGSFGALRIADSALALDYYYVQNYFMGISRNYLEWGFSYINDHRDQRDYPSKGHLIRFTALNTYTQFNQRGPSVYSADLRISKFFPISKNKVLAAYSGSRYRVDAKALEAGKLPYIFSRQLGYGNDYVRGYEPYVADGMGFVLGKLALRQALIKGNKVNLGKGRFLKNYRTVPISAWLSIFADAGRVIRPARMPENELNRDWMTGAGIGLDITAWYSAMSRFELSRNQLGNWVFNISYTNAF